MKTTLLIAAVAFAAGIAVALAIPDSAPRTAPGAPAPAAGKPAPDTPQATLAAIPAGGGELADLERRLEAESSARSQLERRLDALQRQVAELQLYREPGAAGPPAESGETPSAREASNAWFDEQALIASGMDSALAGELKNIFEGLELERLQVRDRAAREGWDRAQRRAQLDALDARELQLRERLGDSAYEAYLYAAGRPNRVAVSSVLASAPAGQAGIRPGDHIRRYAEQRIYSRRDLRAAIRTGEIGEPVQIEVERDGETLQFYLARGPLGVRTDALSLAP